MTYRTGVALAGVALALILASACGEPCDDESITAAVSPGGRYVARAYVRNCGATTAYVTQVELAHNRRWFRNATPVYSEQATRQPRLFWPEPDRLVIECDGCGGFPPDREWENVRVQYRRSSGERS